MNKFYLLYIEMVVPFVYTEEEYRELADELEYVRTIKDSAEKTLKEVREENRLLQNEIAWLKDHTKYNSLTKEEYIDGTMTATEAKLRLQQAEDNQNYVSNLEEENKKLKSDLSLVIDERDNNIKQNKKLRERIKELEIDYDRLKVAFEDVVSGK